MASQSLSRFSVHATKSWLATTTKHRLQPITRLIPTIRSKSSHSGACTRKARSRRLIEPRQKLRSSLMQDRNMWLAHVLHNGTNHHLMVLHCDKGKSE